LSALLFNRNAVAAEWGQQASGKRCVDLFEDLGENQADGVALANQSITRERGKGFCRRGKINIAEGSVEECRYFLILVKDLGYGDTEPLASLLGEVSRLLNAYTLAILTPDSLDSHIPQGYQGEALAS
jgi:hypothetical protein